MELITRKHVRSIIYITIVCFVCFVAGNISHLFKLHRKSHYVLLASDYIFGKITADESVYKAWDQGDSVLFEKDDVTYPFTIIVWGDSREIASYEQDVIVEKIISERPNFVVHTGDIVNFGDEHQWRVYDKFAGRINSSGIPVYPVLGNHEYYNLAGNLVKDPKDNLKLYFSRFPQLKGFKWYTFRQGNCRFIMLDLYSEIHEGSEQYKWFLNVLKKDDSKFTFVVMHPAPYTDSMHTMRSAQRVKNIIEGDGHLAKKNVDIVFSGHVHNYERFYKNGINYIVTAGGGAPPHLFKRTEQNYYKEDGETFHYCKMTVQKNEVEFEMIKFDPLQKAWVISDRLSIRK